MVGMVPVPKVQTVLQKADVIGTRTCWSKFGGHSLRTLLSMDDGSYNSLLAV